MIAQPSQEIEPKTAVELLAGRIRIMASVSGLTRAECHETVMSARNPPTEEEFHLAYSAAIVYQGRPRR